MKNSSKVAVLSTSQLNFHVSITSYLSSEQLLSIVRSLCSVLAEGGIADVVLHKDDEPSNIDSLPF